MQTATIKKPMKNGSFRQIITPNAYHHSILIPRKLVGQRVEVVISAVPQNTEQKNSTAPTWDPGNKLSREEMFGYMRGQYKMTDDFDEPLDDFKEYME